MSNTQTPPNQVYKSLTIGALLVGILNVVATLELKLAAQLTGGGVVTSLNQPSSETMLMQANALHSAASLAPTGLHVEDQMIVGMLFILLGFTMHLLFVLRSREDAMIVRIHKMYPKRNILTRIQRWYAEALDRPVGS